MDKQLRDLLATIERPAQPLRYDEPTQFAADLFAVLGGCDDERVAFPGSREDGALDQVLHALRQELSDRPELLARLSELDQLTIAFGHANHTAGMAFGVLAEQLRVGVIAMVRASRDQATNR